MKRFHMAHFFAEEKIIYLLRITNYIIKIIINNYLSKIKYSRNLDVQIIVNN